MAVARITSRWPYMQVDLGERRPGGLAAAIPIEIPAAAVSHNARPAAGTALQLQSLLRSLVQL